MVPFEPDEPTDLSNVAVLLCAGDRDPIATPDQTAQLAALLGTSGADVEIHREPTGHQLGIGDIKAATDWMSRFFLPPKPRF